MNLSKPEIVSCDVLVIGGGGAGLRAAVQARESGASVILISKSPAGLGNNTALAKAIVAIAAGKGDAADNQDIYVNDTLESGRFINDRRLVERVAHRLASEQAFLEKCGVAFLKSGGKVLISRAPGHSYPRQVQGATRQGTDFSIPLKNRGAEIGVDLRERVFATRLLVHDGRSAGATGFDREGRLFAFCAGATILATGGLGQVYRHTNNAVGETGDGQALAFRAGIPLRDMEFVQFYPTSIAGTRMVSYESLVMRGGAQIHNSRGEDVIKKHGLEDPMVMTRDRLAQAITREITGGNEVIMDLSRVPETTLANLRSMLPAEALAQKRFVVIPCAHFTMGGVVTDDEARTALPGLFACGEVVGGTHGANRLAGNALPEVFAMGGVAGENAALLARKTPAPAQDATGIASEHARLESLLGKGRESWEAITRSLKDATWSRVAIIRNRQGLEMALKEIAGLRSRAKDVRAEDIKGLTKCLELDNMLLVSEMIARAALARKETRGAHYREDHPEEDPQWRASLWITSRNGEIVLEKRPVSDGTA